MNTVTSRLTAVAPARNSAGITPSHIGETRAAGPFIPVQPFQPVIACIPEGDEEMSVSAARGILAMVATHTDAEILQACHAVMASPQTSDREQNDAALITALLCRPAAGSLQIAGPVVTEVNLGELIHG